MKTNKEKCKKLMWYVCYGSNLCFRRLKCYLTGEGCLEYKIKPDEKRKCSDPTLPDLRKCKMINIPYELYFDHCSITWDGSSVAFLDPYLKGETIGRAYLVTELQFEHIKKHECSNGKRDPGPKDLYGYEIDLGVIDGYRAKTFTRFERKCDIHPVNENYKRCMIEGLIECGLSEEEAESYLSERIGR